jgi:hypothetical protein
LEQQLPAVLVVVVGICLQLQPVQLLAKAGDAGTT